MRKRVTTINNISFGLFETKNEFLHDLKVYKKRKKFLKEHGYSPVANWETYNWFIVVFKEILQHYRYERTGDPVLLDTWDDLSPTNELEAENTKLVDKKLDTMIDLLTQMNENTYSNPLDSEIVEKMEIAKNEFFKLFSEYFYNLWD